MVSSIDTVWPEQGTTDLVMVSLHPGGGVTEVPVRWRQPSGATGVVTMRCTSDGIEVGFGARWYKRRARAARMRTKRRRGWR